MATVIKTIGTSGRDYSTIQAWEDDLDNGAIYAAGDIAIGECYNDSTFTEGAAINGGGGIGLAGVIIRVADGERHDGTAGTGVIIAPTAGSGSIFSVTTIQNALIDGFEIDLNSISNRPVAVSLSQKGNGCIGCIAHGGEAASVASLFNGNHFGTSGAPYCYFANCIGYDLFSYKNGGSGISYAAFGITGGRGARGFNLTAYNVQSGREGTDIAQGIITSAATFGLSNCVVCDTYDANITSSSGTQSYNATSDATATGTGSLTNIVTADQFVSTVPGSEDLHLKANSVCIRAGTDLGTSPVGVEIDIDGYNRDTGGKGWSIGAAEWVRTTTVSIGTDSRDYSTFNAWEDDMTAHAGGFSIGDDVIVNVYNDSVYNETLSYNGSTLKYDSLTITVPPGERHDGTAGTGARVIVPSGSGNVFSFIAQQNFLIEYLEMASAGITTGRREALLSLAATSTAHNSGRISKMLCHDAWQFSSGGAIYLYGYFAQNYFVENCIVYNWGIRTTSTTQYGRGGITTGQYTNSTWQIVNCTVHNVQSFDNPGTQVANCFNVNTSVALKNCLATDAEDDCINSTATQTTNATSDATGTLTNIVTADQYVSTVPGSEDLHLKAGSDCIGAGTDLGTTPTGVNIDIDGRDRDAEGDVWDIGADQYVAGGPAFNPAWAKNINSIIGGGIC